jgi:hypothetical protein
MGPSIVSWLNNNFSRAKIFPKKNLISLKTNEYYTRFIVDHHHNPGVYYHHSTKATSRESGSGKHQKLSSKHKNSILSEPNDLDGLEDTTIDQDVTKERVRQAIHAPSILSSDLDTTTFFDTENDDYEDDDADDDGQFSSITHETTSSTVASSQHNRHHHRKNRHAGGNNNKHVRAQRAHMLGRHRHESFSSSMTSLTDSTMSLNIITVTLNMDTVNFLGISIVGQSNKGGEGGIYVGSIMSGGAVAQDGRIEPGDMILQVNEVSFENMSNDDAVRVLREAVMKPG